jgi:predicted O-methyltransferase YrrM
MSRWRPPGLNRLAGAFPGRQSADGPLGFTPVTAADSRWSVVSSAIDLRPKPTDALIRTAIDAAAHALDITLADVAGRGSQRQSEWLRTWPGEHYRFLAGLIRALQPALAIEIGTYQGMGTLALAAELGPQSRLVTFDVVDWRAIDGQFLIADDFADGRLSQELADLSNPAVFETYRELLLSADFIFVDAPKDGVFEPAFLAMAEPLWRGSRRHLLFDDIRLMPMVQLWRDLPFAKMDCTSFGHWSGTGLAVTH